MIKTKKPLIIFASSLLLIIFFNFLLINNSKNKLLNTDTQILNQDKAKVIINDITIYVDIADTPEKMARGLSGRKSLEEFEGMLFDFGKKLTPRFWMKDMLIPIDIIWIADGEVVGIEKNVPPPEKETADSQLPLYHPPKPINYVLEVNTGFADKNDVSVQDMVKLEI